MSNSTTTPSRPYPPCPACGQEWNHGFAKSPYSDVLLATLTENKALQEQLAGTKERINAMREALLECTKLLHALPSRDMPAARAWIEAQAGEPIT